MGRLSGKVAIITGAAKGLGAADARRFAAEGATVVLTDTDAQEGESVAREIGSAAQFRAHDVTDDDGWRALVDATVRDFGGLDALVNNAGIVEPGTIETQTLDELRAIMAVSGDGAFLGCQHAVRVMRERGGAIVNMCSIASVIGEPIVVGYAMAKGAVESLTRSVAVHCAQNGYAIRCNSVHPAGILTPMVTGIGAKLEGRGDLRPNSAPPQPSALGDPEDVAHLVTFLASDEARFINGAMVRIDNAKSIIEGVVP